MAKKFSFSDKVNYHKARLNNSSVSENKKIYSRHWLAGSTDPHAKFNYASVCEDLKHKKFHSRGERIMYTAYRNGLKANLDSQKK